MNKIVLGIEGMGCEVCEGKVKAAIESKYKVKKVTASAKEKNTVIITEEDIDKDAVAELIKNAGFSVTSFTSAPYKKMGIFG